MTNEKGSHVPRPRLSKRDRSPQRSNRGPCCRLAVDQLAIVAAAPGLDAQVIIPERCPHVDKLQATNASGPGSASSTSNVSEHHKFRSDFECFFPYAATATKAK